VGYRRPDSAGAGSARQRRIRVVLWAVLGLNVAVAVAKLAWGSYTNSTAMQADGFHSLFDGVSNIVGLVGLAIAGRPADRDHPYGHGKFETYASAAIGAMLLFAAYRIGSSAIGQIFGNAPTPTVEAASFAVMGATLVINLSVTFWERREGRRLRSEILMADASHTASDALVSIGVIVGLLLVQAGYTRADAVAALLVALAIIRTAWAVLKQANATLSDSARLPPADVCSTAKSVEGVLGCHHVRTRGLEAEVYVDLHVQVAPSRTVADGHALAEQVERAICERFPQVADVLVHLEPLDEYQEEKTAQEIDAGLA
jgi:cation diffusion facilitator family transporter